MFFAVVRIIILLICWTFVMPMATLLPEMQRPWHRAFQMLSVILYFSALMSLIAVQSLQWHIMVPAVCVGAVASGFQLLASYYYLPTCKPSPEASFRNRCLRLFNVWLTPILGWVLALLSLASTTSLCDGDRAYQCAAHWSLGSVIIWYGVLTWYTFQYEDHSAIIKSLEFESRLEGYLFLFLGISNSIGEHWNSSWTMEDMQHTAMGVFVLAAAVFGLIQTRYGKTNITKSVIFIILGWAIAAHGQHSSFSTEIHRLVGYILVASGVIRCVELICCQTMSFDHARVLRQFSSLAFVISGMLFAGATDHELELVQGTGIDPVSYFLLFCSASLIHLSCISGVHKFIRKRLSTHLYPPGYLHMDSDAECIEV